MAEKRLHGLMILILAGVLLIMNIGSLSASDDLYLTGIVKSVDTKAGVAIIDVRSGACSGEKSFRVKDISAVEDRIGDKISFYINSSRCAGREEYKITKIISR